MAGSHQKPAADKTEKQKTDMSEKQKKKQETEISVIEETSSLGVGSNEIITTAAGLDITASDIDVPYINIVQQISKFEGPTGAIMIDKQHVMALAEEDALVTIVSVNKAWTEDAPFGKEPKARIAHTEEEANELAKTSDFAVLEFADIMMLFKQPEDNEDDLAYPFPCGDGNYALGKIQVRKNGYRQTYKRLATRAAWNPKAPLYDIQWKLKSSLITMGPNSWYAPMLTQTKIKTDQAVMDFVGGWS